MSGKERTDSQVWLQTVLISTFLLTLLLSVGAWGLARLLPSEAGLFRPVLTGLELLLLWLVATSALRSINRLRPSIAGWKLLPAGLIVVVLGFLLYIGIAQVFSFAGTERWSEYPLSGLALFFAGTSLVISLISLINLRVPSQMLGNILEFLVIAVVIFLFFYFMK